MSEGCLSAGAWGGVAAWLIRLTYNFQFYTARFQRRPEFHIAFGVGLNVVRFDFGSRIGTVQRFQRSRVSRDDGIFPLLKRSKIGGSWSLTPRRASQGNGKG